MTDIDGDEEDGLDEAWIPYDGYLQYSNKDRGENHLVDDEIGLLLTKVYKKTDFLRPVNKKVKTATIFVVKTRS